MTAAAAARSAGGSGFVEAPGLEEDPLEEVCDGASMRSAIVMRCEVGSGADSAPVHMSMSTSYTRQIRSRG